jgi:hypothetical protein
VDAAIKTDADQGALGIFNLMHGAGGETICGGAGGGKSALWSGKSKFSLK